MLSHRSSLIIPANWAICEGSGSEFLGTAHAVRVKDQGVRHLKGIKLIEDAFQHGVQAVTL